jgi:hypothetical protein
MPAEAADKRLAYTTSGNSASVSSVRSETNQPLDCVLTFESGTKKSASNISPTSEHLGSSIVDELIAAGAKVRISLSRCYYIADARNMDLVDVYNMETREWDVHLRQH